MAGESLNAVECGIPYHVFEEFFALSSDLMVTLDRDGHVVQANYSFLRTLEQPSHKVTGQLLAKYVVAEDQPLLAAALEKMHAGCDPERVELQWRVQGKGMVRCVHSFLASACGKHILAIGRNLDAWHRSCTARCREHQAMERLIDERTRELKLANTELEAFNFSVSHDLRAPLRAISGISKTIIEDYGSLLDNTGLEYLRRIQVNSDRMTTLTGYLLRLSRLSRQELHCKTVDLGQIADTVISDLRVADPQRDAHFSRDENMVVSGDGELLFLLMQNLLDNAWKYTSHHNSAEIVFSSYEDKGERVFVVADNGVGFPMSQHDRLFVLFQRLHQSDEFSGMGIGLATAQRVVERHGGRIWAESLERESTKFYFTLNDSQ